MSRFPRRTTRLGAAVVLGLSAPLAAVPAAAPVGAAEIRTETTLGGFRVNTVAAPLLVLIDDPSVPIPRPPDGALLEADPAYTSTTLSTGPTSRAVASTLWPGSLIGDGLSTATGNEQAVYPLKADANYPGSAEEQVREDRAGSGIMRARAQGLDVVATATTGEVPAPVAAVVDLGQVRSSSTSTVEKDVAIGRAVSQATDVSLAGQIRVKSIRSELETRSDGRRGSSTGTTLVTGLSVAGFSFSVDGSGLHLTGTPAPPVNQPLPPTEDVTKALREGLGITIEPPTQTATSDSTRAARTAKGLRITIDTAMYRNAVNTGPTGVIAETAGVLLESIPSVNPQIDPYITDAKKQLYYLFYGTPKITYVLGAGSSTAAANLPLRFDLGVPDVPFDTGTGGTPGTPGSAGSPLVPGTPGSAGEPTAAGAVPAPQVPAAPTALPPALAGSSGPVAGWGGIGAGVMLLTIGLAVAAAWGLNALSGLALAGAALGRACRFGAPSTVPDLRTS